MNDSYKFLLDESPLPKFWYNINADMSLPPAGTPSWDKRSSNAQLFRRFVSHEPHFAGNWQRKMIAFNLSGHFDIGAYYQGKLADYKYPAGAVDKAMAHLLNIEQGCGEKNDK